jgi:hypothetical protein
MEVIAVVIVLTYVGYLAARAHKSLDIKPRINKSHVPPRTVNHEEYIKGVVAENEEKERVGKLKADNQERIKKDLFIKS